MCKHVLTTSLRTWIKSPSFIIFVTCTPLLALTFPSAAAWTVKQIELLSIRKMRTKLWIGLVLKCNSRWCWSWRNSRDYMIIKAPFIPFTSLIKLNNGSKHLSNRCHHNSSCIVAAGSLFVLWLWNWMRCCVASSNRWKSSLFVFIWNQCTNKTLIFENNSEDFSLLYELLHDFTVPHYSPGTSSPKIKPVCLTASQVCNGLDRSINCLWGLWLISVSNNVVWIKFISLSYFCVVLIVIQFIWFASSYLGVPQCKYVNSKLILLMKKENLE